MQYTVTEKQNTQSHQNEKSIKAANLSTAKRIASKRQFFHGTIMEIKDNYGVLSIKRGNRWYDVTD